MNFKANASGPWGQEQGQASGFGGKAKARL